MRAPKGLLFTLGLTLGAGFAWKLDLRFEREIAGQDLARSAEHAHVLVVHLDSYGPGISCRDGEFPVGLEGLREAGLGDVFIGEDPIGLDAELGRPLLYVYHDLQGIRRRLGFLGCRFIYGLLTPGLALSLVLGA